jgi:glycosyltransferase involved in cell wall biosynthesis
VKEHPGRQAAANSLNVLLGVHVFFPRHRAGTEVLTLELARGLRSRGHRVQILAGEREERLPERSAPWLTEDVYDGFPVHRIHYGVRRLRDPITHHMDSAARVSLAREVVSRVKPDVVHFHHLFGFSARVIPEIRGMGIPVLFTPTDYWVACPKSILYRAYDQAICDGPGEEGLDCLFCLLPMPKWAGRLAWRIARSSLRHFIRPLSSLHALTNRTKAITDCVNAADRVLPATHFLAGILTRHGVDATRIKVLPYGVDVEYQPDRVSVPRRFSEENPLRLGFIGQLADIKGVHLILEAISLLGSRRSLISLQVYGQPDRESPYFRKLQRMAGEAGKSVRFKGTFPHETIGEILRSIHFLVVPSLWYESTPLVLCSALSAGIPVLVSKLGGMTEIVEDGIDGFLFRAGDAKELCRILESLLENPGGIGAIQNTLRIRTRKVSDYVRDVESEYVSLATGDPSSSR